MAKELPTFMAHSEIEAILRKEKASAASLGQEPPYLAEVAAKPYALEYKVPKFQ